MSLDYRKLVAPPGDGEILIEPSLCEWAGVLEQNVAQQQQQRIVLAGREVKEVRQATRATMLPSSSGRNVIACGHQPAFAHAGVWAKHVVVRHIAGRLGTESLDLIVDNDAPTQPDLIVPTVRKSLVTNAAIQFSQGAAGSAYEQRPLIPSSRLDEIRKELADLLGDRFESSLLPQYLAGFEASSHANDYVDQHDAGRAAIDGSLDALLPEFRVSRVMGGMYVADLLLDAPRFAKSYNDALHTYRERENVRSPDRPLPDLHIDGPRIETALWVYQPRERRRRLYVENSGDRIRLWADVQRIGEVGAAELARDPDTALRSLEPWLIRPRALTLTLWARLLVCDLFVHGIGGAKYDRVTDEIFRAYYHSEPPAFAAVSATLRLTLPHHGHASSDELGKAQRALRDANYNPQRYGDSFPADLIEQRHGLIAESARLRESRADRMERRHVYSGIREVNQKLLDSQSRLIDRLADNVRQIAAAGESNDVADSREYFYALHSRERLETLATRLRESCHAAKQ